MHLNIQTFYISALFYIKKYYDGYYIEEGVLYKIKIAPAGAILVY